MNASDAECMCQSRMRARSSVRGAALALRGERALLAPSAVYLESRVCVHVLESRILHEFALAGCGIGSRHREGATRPKECRARAKEVAAPSTLVTQ
jgi:hypothetical protein